MDSQYALYARRLGAQSQKSHFPAAQHGWDMVVADSAHSWKRLINRPKHCVNRAFPLSFAGEAAAITVTALPYFDHVFGRYSGRAKFRLHIQ
jgi:hypothetical protein